MKKFTKLSTLLPILTGITAGLLLFIFGNAEDAPGLSAIGLAVAFLMIMWGVYNTGMIKKGFLSPILLLCFGACGILLSIVLLLDGEFNDSPWMELIRIALGVILIILGRMHLRKTKGKSN